MSVLKFLLMLSNFIPYFPYNETSLSVFLTEGKAPVCRSLYSPVFLKVRRGNILASEWGIGIFFTEII